MKLTRNIACTSVLLVVLIGSGCSPMSEQVKDPSVGINGGFEHMESGLPVNWVVYTPATLPTGRYELLSDTDEFKEGTRSLKFQVQECSREGGWRSPGIAQEIPAVPGTTYVTRFWIKNQGCDWTLSIGGVAAKTGEIEPVAVQDVQADSWQHVEHEYTVAEPHERLRIELSVRSPGSLWIDGVEIEPIGS